MRRYRKYTIDEFLGTTNYTGASFSPDNSKILVSSDASGIYNAYTIPTGVEPEQLTHSTDNSIFVIGYFPRDERLPLYERSGRQRAQPRLCPNARRRRNRPHTPAKT